MRARGIEACQRCGSADLRTPEVGDGVALGVGQDLAMMACRRCRHVGVPFEFDSEAARRAFEASQAGPPGAAGASAPTR